MTADIDREKLRELCERATGGTWSYVPAHVAEGPSQVRHQQGWLVCEVPSDAIAEFMAWCSSAIPSFLDLADAQAAKIAELEVENMRMQTSIEWHHSQDMKALAEDALNAHARIASLESERDQLRKQVEERAGWMWRAAEALKPLAHLPLWRDHYLDGPDVIDVGQNDLNLYFTVEEIRRARELSAASALEQKEQG